MKLTEHVREGDFFYANWGYDQTNIDFFKVVGVTPKCVKVQQWGSETVRNGRADGYTTVVPGQCPRRVTVWKNGTAADTDAPVMTKRLQAGYQGEPRLAWKSYADLYYWDGTPKHQTASGWGH